MRTEDRPIHVTLPPSIQRTPEIDAWLEKVEAAMNAEAELRVHNLLVYGTSHPEHLRAT